MWRFTKIDPPPPPPPPTTSLLIFSYVFNFPHDLSSGHHSHKWAVLTFQPPFMNLYIIYIQYMHALLCLYAFSFHVNSCLGTTHGISRTSGQRAEGSGCFVVFFKLPPWGPWRTGLDSTESETYWESLAEHNTKDSVNKSLQNISSRLHIVEALGHDPKPFFISSVLCIFKRGFKPEPAVT